MMRRIFVLALVVSVVLVVPSTSAQEEEITILEPWDDYIAGVYPPIPTDERVVGWTYTTNGATGAVELVSSPAVSGQSVETDSFSYGANAGSQTQKSWEILLGDSIAFPCDGDDSQTFEFDVMFDAFPTSTSSNSNVNIYFALGSQIDSTQFVWGIDDDGNGASTGRIFTSTGAQHAVGLSGPVMVVDTWYHITFGAFDCVNESFYITKTKLDDGTEFGVASIDGANLAGDVSPPTEIYASLNSFSGNIGGTQSFGQMWTDNIGLTGIEPEGPGFRYCAEPTETDFGYTYSEGVVFADDSEDFSEAFISFEDYLMFEGDNDNSAYLAKGFTTGSTGVANIANIEAAEEATQSVFFIAFTTGAGGLPSVTTKATEVDKDDGIDGGNFDNSIQVRFLETSTNWAIKFFSNVAGDRNPIGSVVNHGGDPNAAKVYNFTVDSLATTFTLKDGNGNVITTQNLPVGLHNAVWKDMWYVGKGDSLDFNAQTGVDDNTDADDNRNSTCIYDLTGTLVVDGSAGSTPGSLVPDSTSTPTGGGGAGGGLSGFDETTSIWASLITIGVFGLLAIAISRGRFKRGDGGVE